MLLRFLVCWLVVASVQCSHGQVVINEIFYHAPDDVDRLEWIELTNTGKTTVDVSGWSLTGGIEYSIPKTTIVEPGQYLVICKDSDLFREFYDTPALGGFKKSIGNSGDAIELKNDSGIVDAITFTDEAPWPVAADGYGASLERIVPSSPNVAANWSASLVPEKVGTPGGTPGARNARYSNAPPPQISDVEVTPKWPAPGTPIAVTCAVQSKANLRDPIIILYQIVKNGTVSEQATVPMTKTDGGKYQGIVPSQDAGALVRIRIQATDETGAVRVHPSPDLRPATSVYVMNDLPSATVPMAFIITADPEVASALKEATQGNGQSMQARMMHSRMEMMLASAVALEDAWTLLMLDGELSPETHDELRALFREQVLKREELTAQLPKTEDMRAAMQEVQKSGEAASRDFEASLKKVLGTEVYSAYRTRSESQDQSAQFIKQMLPLERLWFAIENQFESSDEQRPQIRKAMAKAMEDRSNQLVPFLQKLQTGKAGFEEVQAAAGELESKMWATLKPILSFRQNRFARQWYSQNTSMMGVGGGKKSDTFARGASAFVHVDTSTGKKQVFDFIDVRPRSAGFKVRFHKDQLFNGMSTANVIFEVKERFVLAEPLAFDLYRRVGVPACLTDFVRLHIDDNMVGYHLLFEQPNRAFLRRNERNANGDLYKLLWYGKGIEGKYELKTPTDYGHEKLLDLLQQLEETSGDEQWAVIQKEINVDQVINYFVVNMCLSHWDGFFNNYFTYHDVSDSGKWELYPWDQDKTWGFHDRTGANEVFTDLPLTFGMEGDVPPGGGEPRMFAQGWWRPGGEFSKPLLANTHFRKRFLSRLRTVLTDIYNEEVYFPVIDRLAERLRPEVTIRAEARGQDSEKAQQLLAKNVDLLKEHLTKRREFLLGQDELKAESP